jgi:hypothetical protein
MPLSRTADGRLGVRMDGGGRAMNVVMNISPPDVAGFRRSQGQIAAQAWRARGRGPRNRGCSRGGLSAPRTPREYLEQDEGQGAACARGLAPGKPRA